MYTVQGAYTPVASYNTATAGRGCGTSITSCRQTSRWNSQYRYWETIYNC